MNDLLHRINITYKYIICHMQVDGPGRWYFAYGADTPPVGVRVGVVRNIAKNRHSKVTNSLKY